MVMNKSNYQEKINSKLQDWKTNQSIMDKRQKPTTKIALDLQWETTKLNLKDSGNLSEEQYKKNRVCQIQTWHLIMAFQKFIR